MANTIKDRIIFGNGHAIDLITVLNDTNQISVQGANRAHIDAHFLESQYDAVKAEIDIPGNLDAITLSRDTTVSTTDAAGKVTEQVYHEDWQKTNYKIAYHLGRDLFKTAEATDTTPEVNEVRTILKLAQLTYAEVQQSAMQAQIDALTLASLGV